MHSKFPLPKFAAKIFEARNSIRGKALLLVAVPLILQVASTAAFLYGFNNYRSMVGEELRLNALVLGANKFWINLTDAIMSRFSRKVLGAYNTQRDYELMPEYEKKYQELRIQVSEDPTSAQQLEDIKEISDMILRIIDDFVQGQEVDKTNGLNAFATLGGKVKTFVRFERLFEELNLRIRSFNDPWVVRMKESMEQTQTKEQGVLLIAALTILVSLLVSLVMGRGLKKGFEHNLQILLENTKRLAESKPLLPKLQSNDELGHLDATFHDMAQALEEMKQARQDFFAMVSHDMRTPLSSIVMTTELLTMRSNELPPDMQTALARTQRNAETLLNLINNLLDMNKVECGEMTFAMEDESLPEILHEAIQIVEPIANQKEIALKLACPDIHVQCDKQRIMRVAVNLISNAVKFAPKNSEIDIQAIADSANSVEVSVRDRGPGIAPEHHAAVFERFKQVSREDSTKKGGSGLGLAICKAFVEAHGGSVGLESKVGEGSRFWFRLPSNAAQAASSPALLTAQPVAGAVNGLDQ